MKYLLFFFLVIFLSCSDDDNNRHEILSYEELCSYIPSVASSEECAGAYLVHISGKEGQMNYNDEFGYYVSLSIENTYDCAVLGILCKGDYAEQVGSNIMISADIHQYTLDHKAAVGGQILVSLTGVTIH